MWFSRASILTAVLSFSIHVAFGDTVVLFEQPGHPVHELEEKVKNLKSGDIVVFSKGKEFKLGPLINCGHTTCIFHLANTKERVIRIPISSDSFVKRNTTYSIPDFINYLIDGKSLLDEQGIPSVHIYESKRREYAVVDWVDSMGTLEDYLLKPSHFPPELKQKMRDELFEFAYTTRGVTSLGDFRADQLHYSKDQGWILLDWTDHHQQFKFNDLFTSKNVFETQVFSRSFYLNAHFADQKHAEWYEELKESLTKSIQSARKDDVAMRAIRSCLKFFAVDTLPSLNQ